MLTIVPVALIRQCPGSASITVCNELQRSLLAAATRVSHHGMPMAAAFGDSICGAGKQEQQGWWGAVADCIVRVAGTWGHWSHRVCMCMYLHCGGPLGPSLHW